MANARSVAVALLLAVMLTGCGSGTSAGGAATAPPPGDGVPNRAFALSAGQCAFKEADAPADVVHNLSIPARGQQRADWAGFTGTWETDNPSAGFQASVAGQ